MKKFTRIIALTAALTMIFALPVMAEDKKVLISSESTDQLVALTDAHNLQLLSALEDVSKFASSDAAMADAKLHMSKVYDQIHHEDQDIANNHLYYLNQVVYNAQQDVIHTQENIANLQNLGATSPYYLTLLPNAQNEFNAAVAKLAQAQANYEAGKVKLAKYFN